MKIYNKLVIDLNSGEVLEEDSFEYAGPIAKAGGGGDQPQTTTQTNDPWSGQMPYLRQLFGEASRLYGGGAPGAGGASMGGIGYDKGAANQALQAHLGTMQPWESAQFVSDPNQVNAWTNDWIQQHGTAGAGGGTGAAPSSVIPFSPETQQALQQQTQMAQSSPTAGLLDATMRGDYLYGGPGFNAAYQAAANKVIPQVNSAFSGAGRSGSGLAQTSMAQGLGDIFAGQYGQERGRQMQALQLAPSVRYSDVDRLAAVGEQREGLQREYAMEPWQRLGQFGSLIQGNYGGTSTTSQPTYRNRAAGALGGATAGGSMFGPWGALGGGLLGYFA